MKLLQLTLKNFKGIESLDIRPNGESINIYGANASGKTTIVDAISWLIFDKDSNDKSPAAFGIKTVDESGSPMHGLEHSVMAEYQLDGGEKISLKKVYREIWTTRRGSSTREHTGHTTDYYWDEEPVQAGQYKDRMENLIPENVYKILSLPNYFPEILPWRDRRAVLTELAEEITNQDVIDENPDLGGYHDLLDGKSEEARRNILKPKKKELNKELDNIPSRIAEVQGLIKDIEGLEEAKEQIEALKSQKQKIDGQISKVNAGGGIAELNVKIEQIEADKQKAFNEHQKKADATLEGARKKVKELEGKVDESEAELRQATREYNQVKSEVEAAEERAESITGDIESAQQRKPDPEPEKPEGPETCVLCGQEVPQGEEHEDHYEEYVMNFNRQKAESLKKLKADFQAAQDEIDGLAKDLKEKEQAGLKIRAKDGQRKQALENTKKELDQLKEGIAPADLSQYEKQKQAVLAKIAEIKNDRQAELGKLQDKITDIETQIERHQSVVHQAKTNQQYRARIKELQDLQKMYGKQLDEVEAGLRLIEEFGRAKSRMITEKVNGMFKLVNWKLFDDQLNDGVNEICEATVNGVKYCEGLNNAARIAAGIDIIETLTEYYQKQVPVSIDNAEAITDIPETHLQLIALYVSGGDKTLRVEVAKEMAVA